MKYKLINKDTGEEFICRKITIDGFDYYVSDEIIKDVRPHVGRWHIEKDHILNKFPTYFTDLSECRLIIASNDSIIDIPKIIVDEVENMAKSYYDDNWLDCKVSISSEPIIEGVCFGFNKSQESNPYSDNDMIDFIQWLTRSESPYAIMWGEELRFSSNDKDYTIKEVLEIWKSQRIKTLYYEI